MSNFEKMTRHPITGEFEKATWLDDYFGNYHYGVKFPDGKVFNPEEIDLPTKDK